MHKNLNTDKQKKTTMVEDQQSNPKRYKIELNKIELTVGADLMEDALNGNLGHATTNFLKTICFIDNKGDPVESNADKKRDPTESANNSTKIGQPKEPKTDNKNDKVKHITKNVTPKKSVYDCNQNGRIYKNKELGGRST